MKYFVITRFFRSPFMGQNHRWPSHLNFGKTIEKPSMSMVNLGKNIQWWWSGGSKTIEKPSKAMVPRKKNITIPSSWKNYHRRSLHGNHGWGHTAVWGGTFEDFTEVCTKKQQSEGTDLSKVLKCAPQNFRIWFKCAPFKQWIWLKYAPSNIWGFDSKSNVPPQNAKCVGAADDSFAADVLKILIKEVWDIYFQSMLSISDKSKKDR